ncbi:MAG: HDIG domain-containing protein [Christensenellaceae bacterium]|jgi:putative nucleotidyltransferase with HDIG domain|nr:HDIG domain-containing protein [Christensenellaceae bacterium]
MKDKNELKFQSPNGPDVKAKTETPFKIAIVTSTALVIGCITKALHFTVKAAEEIISFSLTDVADVLIVTAILMVVFFTLLVYLRFVKADKVSDKKHLITLFSIILVDFVVRLLFSNFISVFVIPFSLAGLLSALLLSRRIGMMTNIFINIAFFLNNVLLNGYTDAAMGAATLVSAIMFGIVMIAYTGKSSATRVRYMGVGVCTSAVAAIIPAVIGILSNRYGIIDAGMYGFCGFVSALVSIALMSLFLPVFEFIFKINTVFRLSEITSLEAPLMRRLAEEAPGTFSHSLMVGNLAELCAIAIGESAQLAKAAGYYHDVGKINNPTFFIENQKGYNPHDDVIPEISVKIITSHTEDGYQMIKKSNLPDIIADVAHEHHGTTSVNYFLYKAQKLTEEDIDQSEFSYTDPKPTTKIAAIVMIADTVEAATRALAGGISTDKEYRSYIRSLIKAKSDAGQFSNCEITFNDLRLIEDTLVYFMPQMHHQRIRYEFSKSNTKGVLR